ncbi:MAG: hypothetical protein DME07_04975 [Candidatus Rokuibacteriota bacterium]|jgi:uronate dehydrogenase|nr:MAG: hypothetical protein DME07_04975 [Candidatus Rokubacteria bacterium]PYN77729.1 MAG: hypothetical protein DMD97_08425 [Candidatus Rokubacteria bacterium]
MAPRTVLVTGMSGLIGGALRRQLEGTYDLRALNRRAVPGVKCHQADIADLDAIAPAFEGVDTVVHLAAVTGSVESFEPILRGNVIGTYNVFEAARRAGVRRVVYASSGATVSAWERDPPYRELVAGRYAEAGTWETMTHQTPTRPDGLYGASKIWGEAIARHYSDAHGLSAICVRIGRVKVEDRPISVRDFAVWCSQRDVVRLLELCITAPATVRFDVFFVVSDNRWGYRDLEHARAVLGFEPRDRAEDHRR